MSLQDLIKDSYQLFQHYADDAQIVLLHPQNRLRSMVIAHLLSEAPKPVYYYAMGPNDVNLRAFLDGFTHDMAVQHPVFGRHLYQLWNRGDQVDREALVDALVADLDELNTEPYMLILDEFDATNEADEVQLFWERVIHRLPLQCQLIINGRTEPRMPWVSLLAGRSAVILTDDGIVAENFYRKNTVENPEIHLKTYGFGPGEVELHTGEMGDWEGHLPRLLYFFVLDRPLVTRAEICETFWPDLHIDQAVNVFHVTKRRLHKALDLDVLVHLDGYYQINPEIKVDYDVELFTTALIRARESENADVALDYWQEAAELYRGQFLQGHTEDWILERRHDFLTGYLEAMQAIAQHRLNQDRPEQALAMLVRAVAEDELYEPIHRDIMRLYADMGRRSEAAAHYNKLIATLKDHNLRPEEETLEVYEEIMAS
jgi:DNA-binding SARP family transcriptional activator